MKECEYCPYKGGCSLCEDCIDGNMMPERELISLDDLTNKVEIRKTFSGWQTVTKEEAIKFVIGWNKRITTSIDKEEFINARIKGTTYAELMKEMRRI